MIGADVSVETDADAGQAVRESARRALLEAADRGFAVSQQRVPEDRGELRGSGVQPREQPDGSIVWGYTAPHARPVEEGTGPHTPPLQALKDWGRRVLGSEAAGAAAWQTIREEGTDAQPYVEPGIDAMRAHLRANGIGGHIDDNL